MSARIRFVQFEVPQSAVHGPDGHRGVPLPEDCRGWVPISVEFRTSAQNKLTHLVLAVWLREEDV